MKDIKNASRIDLSKRNLSHIPEYLFKCRNLRKLDLSHNNIKEIPVEFTKLKNLEILDLSNNSISNLFAKMFEFKRLRVLNLNNNILKSIPKQVMGLKSLTKLFLNGNKLDSIPDQLGLIQSLEELGLAKNNLIQFPAQILNLKGLTHLWIGKNPITNMPINEIESQLTKLKFLYTYNDVSIRGPKERVSEALLNSRGNLMSSLKLITYQDKNFQIMDNTDRQKKKLSRNIFISYSHKDTLYKDEVESTLKSIQNTFPDLSFDFWADTRIKGGDQWEKEIEEAMKRSGVAIFLASRNFTASDFIMKKEVPAILEKAQNEGVLILTLVVGASLVNKTPLAKIQFLNDPSKPLNSLNAAEQDAVYLKLANRVSEFFSQ